MKPPTSLPKHLILARGASTAKIINCFDCYCQIAHSNKVAARLVPSSSQATRAQSRAKHYYRVNKLVQSIVTE